MINYYYTGIRQVYFLQIFEIDNNEYIIDSFYRVISLNILRSVRKSSIGTCNV